MDSNEIIHRHFQIVFCQIRKTKSYLRRSKAEVSLVRKLALEYTALAAARMNARYICRATASDFSLTRYYSRCERMQHRMQFHTLGSSVTFAAPRLNLRHADIRTPCSISHNGLIPAIRRTLQQRLLRGTRTKPLSRYWRVLLVLGTD